MKIRIIIIYLKNQSYLINIMVQKFLKVEKVLVMINLIKVVKGLWQLKIIKFEIVCGNIKLV